MMEEELPQRKSTRIYIDFKDKNLPMVFNYNQLYKREQKEIESFVPLNNSEDSFYDNLLKKAESYVPSDEEDGSDDENLPIGKKGEDYDFADPFIDDSEMLMEEPEDYVLPEFDGFFAYQGPLDGSEGNSSAEKKQTSRKTNNTKGKAAAASSTTKKTDTKTSRTVKKTGEDTKQKKPAAASTSTATTSTNGSKVASDPQTSKKVETKKSSASSSTASTKKKPSSNEKEDTLNAIRVDLTSDTESVSNSTSIKKESPSSESEPLDDKMEDLMEVLRNQVKPEMFATKSKFPSALKSTVFMIGLVLLRKYKDIDEHVVSRLMTILPYNRYTIRKLLATKSGQMRIEELQQEIDEMAIQLKRKIDSMMPEQMRMYNEKVTQYQQERQAQAEATPTEEEAVEKKFRCNEEVRKLLYEIMKADEQSVAVSNLIATITKKPELGISEGKARKMMYQRLLSCWPEGWMNSYEMSRQYSQYKSKVTPARNRTVSTTTPSTQTTKSASAPERKRKRMTPQSSPDEVARKKTVVTSETPLPSPLKLNQTQPTVIDLENDEESIIPQQSSASMKIESLITGPK
ncbi:hypothetical protein K501DRAFT_330983 [Backusella circina FSU 941]|nr:hypothetical protein K501DRAFT_330983 [Backusella circina FSU 941]